MFDEDFKIDKSNVIMLLVTLIILVILIIVSICAIVSLSKPIKDLPDLEITRGRTSTISQKPTTTTTIPTTKVTTTRKAGSPYYDIDVDAILNEEILTKEKILRSDAEEILKVLYEYANKFYNIADNSLIDSEYTLNHVLDGDKDVLTIDSDRYVMVYDYSNLVDKLIVSESHYMVTYVKYDGSYVFIKENGSYYRLENKIGNVYPVLASINVKSFNSSRIEGVVRYYMSDYLEQGHTAPVYKESTIVLRFTNDRWKIYSYIFPTYEG